MNFFPSLEIPYSNGFVIPATDYFLTIWGDGNGGHTTSMSCDTVSFLTCSQVPHLNRFVDTTANQKPPIWGDGNRGNTGSMTREFADITDLNRTISTTTRDRLTIRGQRNRINPIRVRSQSTNLLPTV